MIKKKFKTWYYKFKYNDVFEDPFPDPAYAGALMHQAALFLYIPVLKQLAIDPMTWQSTLQHCIQSYRSLS